MFTCAWDEALTIPSEETAELALRTQQVLMEETGVPHVVDPLGGSFFVEELTDRFEEETRRLIEEIEELGGMVHCIETGQIQAMISERAYEEQRRIESGERALVGVNRYRRDEPPPAVEFYDVDEAERVRQVERLRRIRAERDGQRAARALAELRQAAQGTAVLMPFLVEASLAYCTLGEMVDVLRGEFGEFQEPAVI